MSWASGVLLLQGNMIRSDSLLFLQGPTRNDAKGAVMPNLFTFAVLREGPVP